MMQCKPDPLGFGPVPEIRLDHVVLLKSLDGKDSIIQLHLYYQDGDGDIGLTTADTFAPFNYDSPFYHNLPVTFLVENTSGDYVELINPNNNEAYGNQHERIPNLTPMGKYKTISGTLEINLPADPALAKPSKVKLEIKMIDRALNISNTETTDILVLQH